MRVEVDRALNVLYQQADIGDLELRISHSSVSDPALATMPAYIFAVISSYNVPTVKLPSTVSFMEISSEGHVTKTSRPATLNLL
jgi:hypothetical protein